MNKMILAIVGLALSCPFFLAGCGSSVASVCQRECDCAKACKQSDVQECEDKGNEEQDRAAEKGCSAEFGDVVSCAGAATCKGDELDVEHGCAAEEAAYEKCIGGGIE